MSTTTAAHRHPQPDELDPLVPAPPAADPAPFVLREQVAERLAAHRARRPRSATSDAPSSATSRSSGTRSAHIAAAVAERYAQSPTYRSFLAAEAERSVRHAEAAADVALINAQAIAVAQQQLLSDLEHWDPDPEDFARGPVAVPSPANLGYTPLDHSSAQTGYPATLPASSQATALPVFTVRPFVDPSQRSSLDSRLAAADLRAEPHTEPYLDDLLDDPETLLLLEEEIAFRHDPAFDEPISDPLPLTANLLEFPRQLVAPRKARPRIEEGPLRAEAEESGSQLRIFEVAAEQLSTNPFLVPDDAPEWSSILLAAHPHTDPGINPDTHFAPSSAPFAAPIPHRCKAAAIDGALVLSTLAAFLGVAALTVTRLAHLPLPLHLSLPLAGASVALLLSVFSVLYLALFFTLADATPGMRLARIAFCTFTEENPTRSAMRRRLLFTALATLPLGLGLLWAFLDEDRLGWHDRLSRMYQRSY